MERLLIADSSVPFTDALVNAFSHDFDIHVCCDGETALEELLSFRPDVLILNLQLPYKDGLTVLQEAAYLPPHILATTSYLSPYVERCTAALGVSYTMLCPAVNALRVRVMDMIRHPGVVRDPPDPAAATATHLHILGFKTNMIGYRLLRAAIPIYHNNPRQQMIKELYPAVAAVCDTTDWRSVERSIRRAIKAAWKARDITVWYKYFPDCTDCPSNKKFICTLEKML